MQQLTSDDLLYLRDVLGLSEGVMLRSRPSFLNVVIDTQVEAISPGTENEFSIRTSGAEVEAAELLVVALEDENLPCTFPLSGEAGDLARKMIRAMQIEPEKVAFIEWRRSGRDRNGEQNAEARALPVHDANRGVTTEVGEEALTTKLSALLAGYAKDNVLIFGKTTREELARITTGSISPAVLGLLEKFGRLVMLTTFSPRELLLSPHKKREAWAHLKILMERMR